jgi:uncharacterized membrane protein
MIRSRYEVLRKRINVLMLIGFGFAVVCLTLMGVLGPGSPVASLFGILAIALLMYGMGTLDADRAVYKSLNPEPPKPPKEKSGA